MGTGWVERQEGLYVFARGARDNGNLLRMFLPRSSYVSCETGLPVNATSAAPWISSPGELDERLRRRARAERELRLGEALLELGMLNTDQLQCALATQSANRPLGLLLEMAGAVSRADVQTALAHKAGYPLVDLARYPNDRGLAPGVDMRVTRGIPLMLHRDRLVVAVDKLSSVAGLRSLRADLGLNIVPAFAPLGQVARVLERMG